MAKKKKSGRQVRFLLSKGSPLTKKQKRTLTSEIGSGAVRVKGGRKQIGRQKRKNTSARGGRRRR